VSDGCGCGGKTAEEIRRDVYDNPGEAMNRAKEMGCNGIHTHEEGGRTVFMPCRTHEEYREKNDGRDVGERDAEAYMFKRPMMGSVCPPGTILKAGICEPITVTCELVVDEIEAIVEASSGNQYYRISGIAFHAGVNKNGWGITASLAKKIAKDLMVGSDVTLNHPKSVNGKFVRNTDGRLEETNIGRVTEASYHKGDDEEKEYTVRYSAIITKRDAFAMMESGIHLQAGYGVSIGGSGIPTEVYQAEDDPERKIMIFGNDFDFDHLAMVHKPAYPNANVDMMEKVNMDEEPKPKEMPEASIKYRTDSREVESEDDNMTDENMNENLAAELEALQAEMVLREARIAEFEAAEAARAEESRLALVMEASELGLKGHEDFSADTLSSLIASWNEAHPAPEPVEMAPATPASTEPVEASEAPAEFTPVVASFLNGEKIETPEDVYARAWNAWASAWNRTLTNVEASTMRAPTFTEMNN